MQYTIFIRQLDVSIAIGCGPDERKTLQTLRADISISVETPQEINDRLSDSVCYLTVSQLVRKEAASREWVLLEQFSEHVCRTIFAEFQAAKSVRCRLDKFIIPGAAAVGVEIERSRT